MALFLYPHAFADETAADDYAELEPVAGVQPLPPTPGYEHAGRPSGA